MRYVFVAIFVCGVGLPMAFALPAVSRNSLSVSKADPFVQSVKRYRLHAYRHGRSGEGTRHHHGRGGDGIHPLVGSGDY